MLIVLCVVSVYAADARSVAKFLYKSAHSDRSPNTYFFRANVYVEKVSFVSDLQDFWPRVAMSTQLFLVDEQPGSTHSYIHIAAFRILHETTTRIA